MADPRQLESFCERMTADVPRLFYHFRLPGHSKPRQSNARPCDPVLFKTSTNRLIPRLTLSVHMSSNVQAVATPYKKALSMSFYDSCYIMREGHEESVSKVFFTAMSNLSCVNGKIICIKRQLRGLQQRTQSEVKTIDIPFGSNDESRNQKNSSGISFIYCSTVVIRISGQCLQ
jgi:hypothetical protein